MKKYSDSKIIESWQSNVSPWVKAVRDGEIASRRQITNQAIIDAVVRHAPDTVLDVGCGEGWLARKLEALGIATTGIDAIAELIQSAQQAGAGSFRALAYEDLSPSAFADKFDALVCNFSLLGNESVVHLFQQARGLLKHRGCAHRANRTPAHRLW